MSGHGKSKNPITRIRHWVHDRHTLADHHERQSRRRIIVLGAIGVAALGGLGWVTAETIKENHAAHTNKGFDPGSPNVWPRPDRSGKTPAPMRPHEHLARSSDLQLQRLAEQERALNAEFSRNVIHTYVPTSVEQAQRQARIMAGTLNEYARQGIRPVVLMEPRVDQVNLTTLADGANADVYRHNMDAMFQALRAQGINSDKIGTWVPFPRPNVPEWRDGVTNSNTFQHNYRVAANSFRAHFGGPNAKLGVLLDGTTYSDGDTKWESGKRDGGALLPYVTGLMPEGTVTSFGLQGFPRRAGDHGFLSGRAAIDCANALGGQRNKVEVWMSTGTYATAPGAHGNVTMDTPARAAALRDVAQQAQVVYKAGFDVGIDLRVYDGFGQGEPDFSYGRSADDQKLLAEAVQHAHAADTPILSLGV